MMEDRIHSMITPSTLSRAAPVLASFALHLAVGAALLAMGPAWTARTPTVIIDADLIPAPPPPEPERREPEKKIARPAPPPPEPVTPRPIEPPRPQVVEPRPAPAPSPVPVAPRVESPAPPAAVATEPSAPVDSAPRRRAETGGGAVETAPGAGPFRSGPATPAPPPAPPQIPAVTVEGVRTPVDRTRSEQEAREELQRVPGGTAVVGQRAIEESRAANLKDALDFVPGVMIRPRAGGADESQLSIRGSGLRNNFHLRGINVLPDGFVYGQADGFSDFESLELLTAKRIEVYENLANIECREAQFFFTSRLRGEPPEGVDDLHLTPGAGRSFLGGLAVRF